MYHHLGAVDRQRRSRYSGTKNLLGGGFKISYPGTSWQYRNLVRQNLRGLGCPCSASGFAGLGDTARVQSSVQYASMGAKVGSIIPGVGTAIGFVAGLVIGAVLAKKKPVRPSGQQVANCKALLQDYTAAAAQSPALPLPLTESALKDINWCLMAVYGRDIRNKDPRYFDGDFVDLIAIARNIVQQIFKTPVGQTVNISETSNRVRGQTFKSSGLSFTNPPFTNLLTFANEYFLPLAIQYCQQTAGKGSGGCAGLFSRPEFKRWLYDLLGFCAASELPNITPEQLNAPAPVQPSAPVVAVSNAPQPILTYPAPAQLQPVSAVPTPQLPGSVSPVPAPPGAPAGAYEQQLAAQLRPMIDQLLSQGADQKYAFSAAISSLAQRGIEPTQAVQSAVADAVSGSSGGINPWLIVGGGLAVAILTFVLAGKRR